MAVLSAVKGNNSFKMAGANKEQKIDKHKPRYGFSRDVYKGSGFFPSPPGSFSTICLCSSHMLRAAAPCSLPQPQTPPQGFGTPTTAHQTSWIQHLKFHCLNFEEVGPGSCRWSSCCAKQSLSALFHNRNETSMCHGTVVSVVYEVC